MRCIHCQGEMEWKAAPFQVDRKTYHLTLEAVPAWVCRQCGEAYFEEREVGILGGLLVALDQKVTRAAAH